MKRGLGVLAVAVVLMFLANSVLAADVVELTLWHHEAPAHRVKAIQDVINRFEEENPGVRIRQEVVSWDDAYGRTISGVRSGTVPDLQWDIPELNIVAYQAGGILPLTDVVEELKEKYGIFDSQLACYYYDGEYWGVPIFTMPMVLVYRPSYLEKYVGTTEPPKTWEEVLEYAEKLTVDTTGDGLPDIFGIGLTSAHNLLTQELVWAVMSSYGVNVFDAEGNVTFNSPETVAALDMYAKLYKFAPPAASGWGWGEYELNLAAGSIAMAPFFTSIQRRLYEAGDFDFAATLLPVPAAGGRGTTLSYPNGVHIFKITKERGTYEAAKEFVKFMLRPDISAMLTAIQEPGCFVPVTEAAYHEPTYWEDPIIKAFEDVNRVLFEAVEKSNLYGFEHGHAANLAIGPISGANLFAEVVQKATLQGVDPAAAVAWGESEILRYVEESQQ